jgi:hypothetical protein
MLAARVDVEEAKESPSKAQDHPTTPVERGLKAPKDLENLQGVVFLSHQTQ